MKSYYKGLTITKIDYKGRIIKLKIIKLKIIKNRNKKKIHFIVYGMPDSQNDTPFNLYLNSS